MWCDKKLQGSVSNFKLLLLPKLERVLEGIYQGERTVQVVAT